MIEGLGFVRLEVTDLERSLAFYRDALRFEVDRREDDEDPRQVYLAAGDLHVVLAETLVGSNRRGHGVRLSVEVSGVDAYHDALVARGVDPTSPSDVDSSRSFTLRDPDGYTWVFRQSLH